MHPETQTEWEIRMFGKIISYLRDELCIDFPYLERALSALSPEGKEDINAFATEGIHLYFPPAHYLRVFEENELFLRRAYLHTVLHCLYAHPWQCGSREEKRWNTACDIAIEYIIDGFNKQTTRRLLSWLRQQFYKKMPAPSPKNTSEDTQKKWQKIARQTQFRKEKSDEKQEQAVAAMQEQIAAQKRRRSYADFLKKFAAFREQMRCDMDTFDLTYYTYGLRIYGRLPLIEPLETREERRIQEFVIAVDTSYSTSGELVRSFLQETLHILLEEHAFFSAARVHLIQCDEKVQEDIVIRDAEQAERLLQTFAIRGGGGTDFRPVFTYVEELRARGELKRLGGLLYFTDGNGIYPKKKPDYPCAFLYMGAYDEEVVPAWAIRRRLDEQSLGEEYKIR